MTPPALRQAPGWEMAGGRKLPSRGRRKGPESGRGRREVRAGAGRAGARAPLPTWRPGGAQGEGTAGWPLTPRRRRPTCRPRRRLRGRRRPEARAPPRARPAARPSCGGRTRRAARAGRTPAPPPRPRTAPPPRRPGARNARRVRRIRGPGSRGGRPGPAPLGRPQARGTGDAAGEGAGPRLLPLRPARSRPSGGGAPRAAHAAGTASAPPAARRRPAFPGLPRPWP
ncbi:translation initiation factor IF-2-like [Equus quagga]|uniref:translation initiation factor IF-2-like n=1 Tax=Equus quagga TaxID=89248 RepID=UPI001EE27BA7|nr:translation initiation factor IF-2-like [Equus quagga]